MGESLYSMFLSSKALVVVSSKEEHQLLIDALEKLGLYKWNYSRPFNIDRGKTVFIGFIKGQSQNDITYFIDLNSINLLDEPVLICRLPDLLNDIDLVFSESTREKVKEAYDILLDVFEGRRTDTDECIEEAIGFLGEFLDK